MTESGIGLNDRQNTSILSHSDSPPPPPLTVGLSLVTLISCITVLLQVDLPLLRFLRAVNLSSVQTLGDVGERIGNGGTLIAVSLTVLAIGRLRNRPALLRAGVESLLAHACVALVVNGLKHLIARPRPRLTHSGEWLWWPSWDSGLDSLPSGHSSASFAVATVFAKHFPRTAWLMFTLATWVTMSRVWRGSHFVTDVVAGMAAGYLVGTLFVHPLRDWRKSLSRAIADVTAPVVIVTTVIWVILHRLGAEKDQQILFLVGTLSIILALISRWVRFFTTQRKALMRDGEITLVIWLGLSCVTGSFIVIGLTILAVVARWTDTSSIVSAGPGLAGPSMVWKECLYAVGVAFLVALIVGLKASIPIL